jgi:regulator of sirC expression with transglutaminase-like and TPR domain
VFGRAKSPLDAIDPSDALSAFVRSVRAPDADIDLASAAITMVRYADADVHVPHYLKRLDQLASATDARAPLDLAAYLFGQLGFSGNQNNYGDPRNSYLHFVIDRRLGIPITLSVLFLEVARRCGIRAYGVGLPGHFIVGAHDHTVAGGVLYLDPFNQGMTLTADECRERVITTANLAFDDALLLPVSNRYILTRMLHNLKGAHAREGNLEMTASASERLLALNPADAEEAHHLGLLYSQTGRGKRALQLLHWAAEHTPGGPRRDEIRSSEAAVMESFARQN